MTRLFELWVAPILAVGAMCAVAQQETGSVTGYVYCADTQEPARAAQLVLVPAESIEKPAGTAGTDPAKLSGALTRMDGSFSAGHVPPGNYFVLVIYAGYLSDLPQPDSQHSTPDYWRQVEKLVPMVTVAAGKATGTNVTIHRGGSIEGTVRYDDGSPVPDVPVDLLVLGPAGRWNPPVRTGRGDFDFFDMVGTDDLGRFRIPSLTPGIYSLRVNRYSGSDGAGLWIYYGNRFTQSSAKEIKIGDGESSTGNDLTIQLAQLHRISGTVAGPQGEPINSAKIALVNAADGAEVYRTSIDEHDPTFHLELVPEGNYTVRVSQAEDVQERALPSRGGDSPEQEQKILNSFGDFAVPLLVTADTSSLLLTAPQKKE